MWYLVLWIAGLVTAGLTAFYTFRGYFLTFWGEERIPPEAFAHHHGHDESPRLESPPVMTVPLMVLAVFALGIGAAVGPTGVFEHFMGRAPVLPKAEAEGLNWIMMTVSSIVALGGIGVAWLMYVRQPDLPGRLANAAQGFYQLSLNKFHIDELYDTFILKPLAGFTTFTRIFDLYVLDGLVDLIGQLPRLVGFRFRPVQNGLVQFYALAMVLGLTVFLIALVTRL